MFTEVGGVNKYFQGFWICELSELAVVNERKTMLLVGMSTKEVHVFSGRAHLLGLQMFLIF